MVRLVYCKRARPLLIYHVTSRDRLESILADGLHARTCFVHEDWTSVIDYYRLTVEDEDLEPVVVTVDAASLDPDGFEPDWGGIEEPLTHTLQMTEDEVSVAWKASDRSWQACIEIMGTCRYARPIPASRIRVCGVSNRATP